MTAERRRPALDTFANISCIVVCVLLAMTFARDHFGIGNRDIPQAGISSGDVGPEIPGLQYSEASATVIIFISAFCAPCLSSLSDYAELQNLADQSHGKLRIVSLIQEREAEHMGVLKTKGLNTSIIIVPKFSKYKVSATPTLLVVGKSGLVKDLWIGKVTPVKTIKQTIEELIRI